MRMKKTVLVFVVAFIVLLQGCSNVSQEEYDKLVEENSELMEELESVKADYGSVQQKNKELLDEKAERVDADLKLAAPNAWATTHFGDDCIVFVDNEEYLQVISKEKYTLSSEGIQAIWKKILESSATLAAFLDEINYERIGIKFFQDGGTEMWEIVLKRENGKYNLDFIFGDLFNTTTINEQI